MIWIVVRMNISPSIHDVSFSLLPDRLNIGVSSIGILAVRLAAKVACDEFLRAGYSA